MLFLKLAYYKWLWQALTHAYIKFHPTSLSVGSRISPYVHLAANVTLAQCEIGSYSYISKGTSMHQVQVGRFCSIGPECMMGMGTHPTDLISTSPVFFAKSSKVGVSLAENWTYKEFETIKIGHDVWIGSRVIIMDGCQVGNGAIIGAGAVVTKNVKPYSIVGGIPAREIKMRFDDEFIKLLETSSWWKLSHKELKASFDLVCKAGDKWNQDAAGKIAKFLIKKKEVEL